MFRAANLTPRIPEQSKHSFQEGKIMSSEPDLEIDKVEQSQLEILQYPKLGPGN